MSDRIKGLLVLLATDETAARDFERDPAALADRLHLDPRDMEALRTLRVERRASAPRRLEERLSRSGMGFAATLHDASQGMDGGSDGGQHDDGGSGSGSHHQATDDGDAGSSSRATSHASSRPDDAAADDDRTDGHRTDDEPHGRSATGGHGGTPGTGEPGHAPSSSEQAPSRPAPPTEASPAQAGPGGATGATGTDGAHVPAVPAAEKHPGPRAPSGTAGHPGGAGAHGSGASADGLWDDLDGDRDEGTATHPAAGGEALAGTDRWGQVGPATTVPAVGGAAPGAVGPVMAPSAPSPAPSPAPTSVPGPTGTADHDLGPRAWATRFRDSLLEAAGGGEDGSADPEPGGSEHTASDHGGGRWAADGPVDALAGLVVDLARGEVPGGVVAPGLQDAAQHVLDLLHVDLDGQAARDPTMHAGAEATTHAAPDPTTHGAPAVGNPPDGSSPPEHPGAETSHPDATHPDGTHPDDAAAPHDPGGAAVVPPPRPETPTSGPAGTYRGGVVGQQALPGDDGRLRVTYADGSQRDVTRSVVDGRTTDAYTTADGVETTETYGPDGGWTESGPDGASTVATRSDGVLTEEVHDPDGAVTTTTASFPQLQVLEGQEQFATTTTGPDGVVVGVRVVGTADGGAVAITSDPPATATTRVGLTDVGNADGSVTRTFTFPDGRTEAFTVNTVGEVLAHEVQETGGHYAPVELPDTAYRGGVVLEVPSGTTPGAVEQHLADGTVREVTRAPDVDGGHTDTWTETDGTVVVAGPASTSATAPDGTVTVLDHGPDEATQTVTAPDGTVRTATAVGMNPDNEILHTTVTTPGGAAVDTSVVLDVDGTGALATITGAGTVEHVRVAITDVPNPDGSTTHLLRFPDGRTEVLTTGVDGGPVALETRPGTGEPAEPPGDPNADVNGSFHGGTLREETTVDPATGAAHTVRTYADGTVVEIGADGTYTLPDGSRVTEQTWATGVGGMTTVEAPDGTVSEDSFDGTTYLSGVNRPDGSSSSTTWGGPGSGERSDGEVDDGALFRTTDTDPDGGQTVTSVAPLNDGGALATITRDGTAVTVRVGVEELENVDGSTTRVYTFPDGRTEAFTFDADFAPVHHESHPGDGSPVGDLGPAGADDGYRGGVVGERIVSPQVADPPTPATVEILRADGTTGEVQRWEGEAPGTGNGIDPQAGATRESWTTADGTRVTTTDDGTGTTRTEVGADGSRRQVSDDPEKGFVEDRATPDGTTARFRVPPDGLGAAGEELFATDRTSPGGQSLHTNVVRTADGGAMAVMTRSDGVSATARLDVREVGNPDGSTTRVYTFPDGRTESVTVDGRTGEVVAHEAVIPGAPEPAAAPPTPALAGTPEVSVDAEGTRTELRTYVDGSTETVTTEVTGAWTSEITDPHGSTLHTDVGPDGSVEKLVTLADGSSTSVLTWPGNTVVTATDVHGVVATTGSYDDGRLETGVTDPSSGTSALKVQHPDGSVSQSATAADGTTKIVSLDADGTATESVWKPGADSSERIERPDGSVHEERFDVTTGRTITVDARPGADTVQVVTDGTTTSTMTEAPDGTESVRTEDTAAGTTTTLTTRPDRTWTKVDEGPGGARTEQTLTADGRIVTDARAAGGGPHTVTELRPDGSRTDTVTDPDGDTTTRVTAPDGTWTSTASDTAGTTVSTLAADGSLLSRVTAPDGDWTEVHQFVDGSRWVGQHTAPAEGTPPVPTDVLRFEGPGGDSWTKLTYPDGSRLEASLPAGVPGADVLMHLQKFDPDGVATLAADIPHTLDPRAVLPELPKIENQSVTVAGSFSAAWGLQGKVAGAFDNGVFSGSGFLEGRIGASISGQGSITVGADGVDLQGSAEIFAGADGRAGGHLSTPIGDLDGQLSGAVALYAKAVGSAHLGTDGIQAQVSLDAMMSARAGGNADIDLEVLQGGGAFEAGVGLGLEIDADASVTADDVGFNLEFGAGLLLSADFQVDLHVSPSDIVDGVTDAITDPVGAAGKVIDVFGDAADDVGSAARDVGNVADDAYTAAGEGLDTLRSTVDDALSSIPDTLGDIPSPEKITDAIGSVADDAVRAAGSAITSLGDAAQGALDTLGDAAEGVGTGLKKAGEAVVDTVGDVLDVF